MPSQPPVVSRRLYDAPSTASASVTNNRLFLLGWACPSHYLWFFLLRGCAITTSIVVATLRGNGVSG
eukprot:5583960-Prorocentrum_lima.AAC.1